jgi:threonine dehydratase
MTVRRIVPGGRGRNRPRRPKLLPDHAFAAKRRAPGYPTSHPPEPALRRDLTPPTRDDVERARAVVAAHLPPTPVVAAPGRDWAGAGRVLFKLETLQPTGSFKVRGALAALAAYRSAGAGGVVTVSAGNHGLGVAFAAARLGLPARIVLPQTASPAKVAALRAAGADLQLAGADYDAAERAALALAAGSGAVFVSPYNDRYVAAGQGTIAAELAEQLPGPMTVVVPVGGGGLITGVATRFAGRDEVRVVGVEAAASPAFSTAVRAGRIVQVAVARTLADGLAGNLEPGSLTPAAAGPLIAGLAAVSEAELRAAVRWLAGRVGLVVEGSGAAGFAAVLAGRLPVPGRTVVVLTGRNIDLAVLAGICA